MTGGHQTEKGQETGAKSQKLEGPERWREFLMTGGQETEGERDKGVRDEGERRLRRAKRLGLKAEGDRQTEGVLRDIVPRDGGVET